MGLLVGSCTPLGLGSTSSDGICETADDNIVNTYQLTGQWKKISPYSPTRTDEELSLNYEMLIVEGGVQLGTVTAPLCLGDIVNNGQSAVLYRGLYEHDVKNKKLYINYTEGSGAGSSATASYSFSGSCSETKLTFTYEGGGTEVYQLYSQTVNSGDCNPQ